MVKTTVYLPEELKRALARLAADQDRSEAQIIREALVAAVRDRPRPRPRIPLTGTGLGDPTVAERADELLRGFGSR